jgi:hypothetical protein
MQLAARCVGAGCCGQQWNPGQLQGWCELLELLVMHLVGTLLACGLFCWHLAQHFGPWFHQNYILTLAGL